MARTVFIALLVVLLSVLAGCNGAEQGKGQLMPARGARSIASGPAVTVEPSTEAHIAERVAIFRQRYREGLELLIEHYEKIGNNMKLGWAKKELGALNTIPQYRYIIEAEVAGLNLKATASIAAADILYNDALSDYKKAKELVVIVDEKRLRVALDKFNKLIRKYPSSDKIDDAAYMAGQIYSHFKDYSIALLYYQRAYQWDKNSIHPARFKAAHILDTRLHQRAEALALYKQFVEEEEVRNPQYKQYAQKRIRELTKADSDQE